MLCGRKQLPIKLKIYMVFVFLSAFCFPMIIIILSYMELVKSVQSVRHDVIHYGNQGRAVRSDFMLKRNRGLIFYNSNTVQDPIKKPLIMKL